MRAWLGLVLVAGLAACQETPDAGLAEKVSEAWVRLPAADGRPGAAYFRLAGGEEGDTLLAVDSPEVATIELHETVSGDNGTMTMRPIDTVDVPPGRVVLFAPGGKHAMLFGIREDAAPGSEIALNFRFDSGRDIQAEAEVVGPGAPSPFSADGDR